MFWDADGRVGICNAETLVVSYLVSIISNSAKMDTIGSTNKYEHIIPYFC